MPERFTLEEHKKRMRDILQPPAPLSPFAERIREAARRWRRPKVGVR